MKSHKPEQTSKLNDLLSSSFNNVKYDIRELNSKIEGLNLNLSNLITDGINAVSEEQTKKILEQQIAIDQLNERIIKLEQRKIERPERDIEEPHSTVFRTKESALSEVKRIIKNTAKESSSVYNIPEGQARITKTNLKSESKDLNGEWVEVTGYGVDMTGFRLRDKKKHEFRFPQGFTIYGPVKIFTGKGKNTNTKLYWNSNKHIWNNEGDVATLLDRRGKIVSQVLSQPTYSFKKLK